MNPKFWHERWEKNEIGFHQDDINAYLRQYWSRLQLESGKRVFVPLCGKSRDMLWLKSQGYPVIGVEVSSIAVTAFFGENDLEPTLTLEDKLTRWQCNNLKILCGSFFDLRSSDLERVVGVYDRASLIALPTENRKHYAQHLFSILPRKIRILLITMEYSQKEMEGPPFAVTDEEVKTLYEDNFQIQKLHEQDALAINPHFIKRGLTYLAEKVYLLNND